MMDYSPELKLKQTEHELSVLRQKHLELQAEYAAYQRYEVARTAIMVTLHSYLENYKKQTDQICWVLTNQTQPEIRGAMEMLQNEIERMPAGFTSNYLYPIRASNNS